MVKSLTGCSTLNEALWQANTFTTSTAQKMKLPVKDLCSECERSHYFL